MAGVLRAVDATRPDGLFVMFILAARGVAKAVVESTGGVTRPLAGVVGAWSLETAVPVIIGLQALDAVAAVATAV